jgi:Terminase large subunit, T4likevirus-type, N-terminal
VSAAPLQHWSTVIEAVASDLIRPQVDFLADRSTWAAAYCSRQCGKGYTTARLMLLVALERPNRNIVYIHQTYAEARNCMWADFVDGLPAVARQLDLHFSTNESRLELTLSNGSSIRLMGADRGAWDKLRGQKLDLIVADEMQKAEDEGLRNALLQVIPDCLAARQGMFRAIGTPDEFCVGEFHDICTGGRPGWALHHWTAEDLQHKTTVWSEQLRWKAEHNIADDDPVWLREKRGLWVRQDSKLLLPVTETGLWDGVLPENIPSLDGRLVPRQKHVTVYGGIDFGFANDQAACVLASVSPEEGVVRETYSGKRAGLNTQQLADWLRRLKSEHAVRLFYADNADPKTIEDLRVLYGLPMAPCQKNSKEVWIQEMRAHLLDGRLRVLRDSVLHDELKVLQPDPKELLRKRLSALPGSEDHAYDAFRYLYRGIHTNHVKAPEPPMTPIQRQEKAIQAEFERRATRKPDPRERFRR